VFGVSGGHQFVSGGVPIL